MSFAKKKATWIGAAALASLAGIGAVVTKNLLDKKNLNTNKESTKLNSLKLTQFNRLSTPLPKGFYGYKIEMDEYYEKLLKEIKEEPKLLWKYFMIILSIPRPSGKLDKIRSTLKKIANLLNVEYTQDKIGNVVLRKSATKGYENAPGVVVQCHMDMVTTKTGNLYTTHKRKFIEIS